MSTSREPLKLLSIDGGGVRGLSAIIMLENIVEKTNARRKEQGLESLEPWQMFDLIGGTSTGGIIAIMLGRLRMTMSECRAAYENLSEKAFTPVHSKGNMTAKGRAFWKAGATFDASKLESAIHQVLAENQENLQSYPIKALLKEDEPSSGQARACKTLAVCTYEDITQLAVFRSYVNPHMIRTKVFDQCKIWEACRATSAAPTIFPAIEIGGQKFLDGGVKNNNPVEIIMSEAKDLWPDRADDAVLISLGTGSAPYGHFGRNLKQIVRSLKEIATETEDTAKKFLRGSGRAMASKGCYYRFTVPNLGTVGLEEWRENAKITCLTEDYVDNPETAPKTESCIRKLSTAAKEVTPEEARLTIWKSDPTTRPTYELSSDEFSALHEDVLDQDYPNMWYWYREKLDPSTHYPLNVDVEPRFKRPKSVVPVGNTVLTCRRTCNLIVRGRFRYILPGKYQVRWVFWFYAGRNCPPSNQPKPTGYVPEADDAENSVLQRTFPPFVAGETPPNPDSSFFYPWGMTLYAGQPQDYSTFVEADTDVTVYPLVAPQLLKEKYTENCMDAGLWNTKRNTGWCEIHGSIIEVNDGGRIALLISKYFERFWYGGFSFGGVRLIPL